MTGKYLGSVGLACVLAGCAAAPEGTSQDDVSDYLAAAASIGCELKHESDYAPVEFQAGLTREQAVSITNFLVARGDAQSLEGGGVRVTSGPCTPA